MDERTFFQRADEVLAPAFFNDAQRNAVRGGEGDGPADGPMLIEAGPGSGKTTVLVWRIVYMLAVLRVPAHRICVVTFTKAAADDMRARLGRLTRNTRGMRLGTIHSMARALLEELGVGAGPLVPESVQLEAVRRLLRSHKITVTDELPGQFLNEVTALRNRLQTPEQHVPTNIRTGPLKDQETFAQVARQYLEQLRHGGGADFDGWLEQLYALLRERPGLLEGRFSHILVDEFQDTSLLQYELLRMLAEPEGRLYAVGDEDQSIYSWRGAGPEVFRGFVDHYPNAGRVVLDVNYRASLPLVATTNTLIGHNPGRGDKLIRSFMEDEGNTDPGEEASSRLVSVIRPAHDAQEAEHVADQLAALHKDGVPWREMAVVYRFNEQSLAFIARFGRMGIPFRILGEPPNPFRSWVGRDIVAYMRLALGSLDSRLLEQIIYRPNRFISREATRNAAGLFRRGIALAEAFAGADLNGPQRARITELMQHLEQLAEMAPAAAVRFILNDVGYDEYLLERSGGAGAEQSDGLAKAVLMETVASEFDELADFVEFARRIEGETRGWWKGFVGQLPGGGNGGWVTDEAVTLTTCHSAKGLEFDVVAVAGLVEDILPAAKADVEEERRLAYVAMTRARHTLLLSAPARVLGDARPPSRFVEEATGAPLEEERLRTGPARGVPLRSVEGGKERTRPRRIQRADASALSAFVEQFPVGTKVRHATFGEGRVDGVDVKGGLLTVVFADEGEKRLGLEVCVTQSLLKKMA